MGSLPPLGARYSRRFGPVATGRGKKKELEQKKEKASATRPGTASHFEAKSPSRTRRQRTARGYARFIGISAEDVLNIVLKKMIANDMEFQSWLSQQNVQQQGSHSPLGLSACVVETEAA
jgi:hypothetical protein